MWSPKVPPVWGRIWNKGYNTGNILLGMWLLNGGISIRCGIRRPNG